MKFKRPLCFLLVLFMLLSCGCSENVDTEASSDESALSDDLSEESEAPKKAEPTEHTAAIDRLLCGTSDRTQGSKNLLEGHAYSTTIAASSQYPDEKNILTDRVISEKFETNKTWAGYNLKTDEVNTITFDLGSTKGGLLDFSVTVLDYTSYGIYAPYKITVSVAGEDKNYTKVGAAYRPDGELSQNAAMDYKVLLHNAAEARYIRYEISGKSTWLFVSEITATAYDASYTADEKSKSDINEYYGYKGIPEITTPKYWSESDKNYNSEINLIKSKKPYISAGEAVEKTYLTEWYNGTDTQKLTDGIKATAPSYGAAQWFHTTLGYSRSITYDLSKTSAVKGFSIGLLYDTDAGVKMPTELAFLISENGIDWQTLYYSDSIMAEKEHEIVRINETFDKVYKARYARIDYSTFSHVFIDEITVTGTKNISDAAAIVPDNGNGNGASNNFLMPEDFFGVNNMLLSYHCKLDENNVSDDSGRADINEYLPYIAYLDEDGNIKDTFFDSALYLPYTNMVHDAQKSIFGRSADGWRNYVNDMFYPDRNMNALEQCADKVYTELGVTDQKIKVFTSILYTYPKLMDGSKNNFGDIDGDGRNENFDNIEDRKKAIKWLMDEEYRRFYEGNYKHLDFCGYYWFEESISYNDPHERELIRFAVDYAHSLGVKVFWIPYRTATGINDWEKLGFDAACLQPNYMFNKDADASVLYDTASKAKQLGMCVELEIDGSNSITMVQKFVRYLNAGAETGYMNAVKMYYQNGVPGAFYSACYSEDALLRAIYDYTYLFAKEKFTPIRSDNNIISETPLEYKYEVNTELNIKLDISNLNMLIGNLTVTLSPKYGDLKLNNDGSFVYYPAEDYKGEDRFKIAYDAGDGELVSTEIIVRCE